jgi:hypothetical protein
MKRAAIFETTLDSYLTQIGDVDLPSRAEVLGASAGDGALTLPLYGTPYRISREGIFDAGGQKANFTVSVVLCRYILQCPATAPEPGGWVTYREFRDAAPLTGYFTTNTNKFIETTFAGRLSVLKEACRHLRGGFAETSSFDLAVVFDFLPRIPVYLRFNDRDDEFPAQSSVLFRRSAECYLDMECLAIGGTLLAGLLISEAEG